MHTCQIDSSNLVAQKLIILRPAPGIPFLSGKGNKTEVFLLIMSSCSSKISIPHPRKGFFSITPLPSGNSIFVPHPLEILTFLLETKTKLFFSARYRIVILTVFFPKKFGGYCDRHITRRYVAYIKDAYRGICDMRIIDLLP